MIWGAGGPVRLPDGRFGPGSGPGSGSGLGRRKPAASSSRGAAPVPAPVPVVWAPVVREAAAGPPFAVVVVETGPPLHRAFVAAALASGFAPAAGEPPDTDAVLETRGGVPVRLRLVGGGEVWEPAPEVPVPAGWLAAAAGRRAVVVIVVPPGTRPSDLAAGPVLHGIATLTVLRPRGAGPATGLRRSSP